MYKSNKIWTHHDKPETYINVVKDNHGMVICFGNNIFSDEAWAPNSPEELYALLKTKCKDATIFAELKAIEQLANKHNVPMSEILFVDCSKPILTPRSVASIVRQAFGFNDTVTSMRTNRMWPELSNPVGIELTCLFLDEIVGKKRHEYCDLLEDLI
jgi:hypothetical protein